MLDVKVGTDQARTQLQISRDKQLDAYLETGVDSMCAGRLAASESYDIPFGKVGTAKMLLIETTLDTEVRLNGAASGPVMKLLAQAKMPGLPAPLARMYLEADITSVTLVNPSSTKTVDFNVYLLGVS